MGILALPYVTCESLIPGHFRAKNMRQFIDGEYMRVSEPLVLLDSAFWSINILILASLFVLI